MESQKPTLSHRAIIEDGANANPMKEKTNNIKIKLLKNFIFLFYQ